MTKDTRRRKLRVRRISDRRGEVVGDVFCNIGSESGYIMLMEKDGVNESYLVSTSRSKLLNSFDYINDDQRFKSLNEGIKKNPILTPYKGFMTIRLFNN